MHLALLCSGGRAQTADDQLKSFLRQYLDIASDPADWVTYYKAVPFDLNGDHEPEFLVYLEGRGWCGSGGCKLLVLQRAANSFQVVANTTVTRTPIKVLPTTHNGWRNLSVSVGGGGIAGYEAELRFDGKSYPRNPTVPPARPLKKGIKGEIVLSDDDLDTL